MRFQIYDGLAPLDLETMLRLREVSVVTVVFDASACFTVSDIDTKLIDEERVT